MPSKYFIANLENKGFKTLEQLRDVVDPVRQQYQSMMVNMDEFMTENPQFSKEPGAIMDIMDSFYRLIPLPVKVGPMCFKCTCTKGFVSFACEHSTIATMLFDPRLEVPPSADMTKIRDRPAKVRYTPFDVYRRDESTEQGLRVKKRAQILFTSTGVGLRRLGHPPPRGSGRGRAQGVRGRVRGRVRGQIGRAHV